MVERIFEMTLAITKKMPFAEALSIRNEAFEEQRKEKHMIRSEISQLEPLEVALTAFHQQYSTFNVCDPAGVVLDCYAMQEQANRYGISVRSGCFCNPGVREVALGFVREDLVNSFRNKERMTFEQFLHVIDNQKQGAVRVSMGLVTNFADVYQFVQFVRTFIDRQGPLAEKTIQPQQVHLPLSERCVCGSPDHRARKVFCPHCGRPLAAVTHPSVKARSSHREDAGGRSPAGFPAHSPESLM